MQNIMVGLVAGIVISLLLYKPIQQIFTNGVYVKIPIILFQKIAETGAPLDLTPSESIKKIIKLGLFALIMYLKNEGGLCYKDEMGNIKLVPFTGTDNSDGDNLSPYKDFIDKMDF